MSGLRSIATAVIVILIAGAAGFLLYELTPPGTQSSFADRINAATSAMADSSHPASSGSSARAAPAAPKSLPAITLPDMDDKPRKLSEWRGRPLLINFWATWCEPCRREIPLLRQLRAEHSKSGLEVLGIAVDFRDAVRGYADQAGIDYPVLIAEKDATAPQAFGVGMGLPTTVFADREGRIVAMHVGELHPDQAQRLVALALGKP